MISPMTYVRYGGARPYLQARRNLQPLCGIWFGVAINEAVTGSTGTHLDFSDSGFNCVIPWGEYKRGALVLWQLKMIVELEPGDAFFFMGSLIAHCRTVCRRRPRIGPELGPVRIRTGSGSAPRTRRWNWGPEAIRGRTGTLTLAVWLRYSLAPPT
jgi:hypothetical protein